jgi:hypothetical protein
MLEPSETSYFSAPSAGLDPRLFENGKLNSQIRNAILQLLNNYLNANYSASHSWSQAWLAGSGVSYQWAAHRDPADLDCLIGVDFLKFRQSNTQYTGLGDKEIAEMLNEGFYNELQPATARFMGAFELTFYALSSPNILSIKPYSAYDIANDMWTVVPSPLGPQVNPEWEALVDRDKSITMDIMSRYFSAKGLFDSATNDAVKANARSQLRAAMSQASSLYESIHSERSNAFSSTGKGYEDFYNYRWQAGKRSGVIQFLRSLKTTMEAQDAEFAKTAYGVDLPDTNTLIRRAATQRR